MYLKDKVVIVTGAGSGVGRALALEFGAKGARVVCVARRSTLPRPEREGGAGVGRRTVKGRASPARRLTER